MSVEAVKMDRFPPLFCFKVRDETGDLYIENRKESENLPA